MFAAVSFSPGDRDALPDETHHRTVAIRSGERGANGDVSRGRVTRGLMMCGRFFINR